MYTAKLLILQALSVSAMLQTGKDTKNLLNKLFNTDKYDKIVRPKIKQGYITTVVISFVLQSIIEFDEQQEALKTAGFLHVVWRDEYLKWNPADYNGIEYVSLPQDKIWKPHLGLRNTFDTYTSIGSTDMEVFVRSSGIVTWSPFQVFQSACSVHIKYFPFDTQTCDLIFTSWSNGDVKLSNFTSEFSSEEYYPNAAWDLVSSDSTIKDINHRPSGIFSLNLKRRPTFFLINIITPVILLSLLNTFTFLLPVESGERAQFSVTVFLSLAVFLTIVSDRLPSNSDTVSLMAIYLTLMTSLSTFIVLACLAQIRLSARKESEQPVTGCYAAMVKLANCCGCNKMGNIQNRLTWLNVVHITDFIFFWLSFIYTILITSLFAYSAFAG